MVLPVIRVIRDIGSSLIKVGHPDFAWDGLCGEGSEGRREGLRGDVSGCIRSCCSGGVEKAVKQALRGGPGAL